MPSRLAPIVSALFVAAACAAGISQASARPEALLLIDAANGRVLHAEHATYPWHPASITKLMTTYVTLRAVKEGRIALDTLFTVSDMALAQAPSKMGFPVGTRLTVDNALKIMMVKSANDMAVVLAEGVSGSIDAFAAEMNQASQRLGMTQSTWVNPNGLPDDAQVTSARDMAILARTLIREFPEYDLYWHIPAIKFGRRVMRNYNRLIDRYPGADGMKTGFICASGYNLVASATRNGRRLIAVVLGSPSGTKRAETAAALLERGFNGPGLSWLLTSLGTVDALQPIAAAAPNLRDEICGPNRGKVRTDHADEEGREGESGLPSGTMALAGLAPGVDRASLLGPLTPSMEPIPVTVIPPPNAPADPDALVGGGRKKPAVQAVTGPKNGRKALMIDTSAPPRERSDKSAAKTAAKPSAKPVAHAKPKPAPASKPKPAARSAAARPSLTRR